MSLLLLLEIDYDAVVYSMSQVMYHVEDLLVALGDNIFDQTMLMTMDLLSKKNLHEHVEVVDLKMGMKMLMAFEMANSQRSIYLCQPMEEMIILLKQKQKLGFLLFDLIFIYVLFRMFDNSLH